MRDAYLVAASRTPIGKFLGSFRTVSAPDLAAITIREALSRSGLDPAQVNEVIMGNVLTAGIGQAPARQAALKAGLPPTVAALTINKVCGSGLKAVSLAAQAIQLGEAEVVIAGGMENMSRSPHLLRGSREGQKLGNASLDDSMLLDGLWCAFDDCHMGSHAEYTAEKYHITRAEQDQYAVESQTRTATAITEKRFQNEIVPVTVPQKKEDVVITHDEGPRSDTNLETLSLLSPAFTAAGTVTAGNSSMISDGAAAVVVTNPEIAESIPSFWRARIVASHTSGVEPRDLFIAPVAAVNGVLAKANLTLSDIDLFEINEAFAAQSVACIRELNLDSSKVNIHGGAIALGHPIGASGARILVTLLSALNQYSLKRGLVSLCLGGGNAVAMIIEREI